MNKSSVLRSRLNVSFGVISLFPIVSVLISIFYSVVYSFVLFFFREGSENILSDAVDFYVSFILPQTLLPVLTASVALLIPKLGLFEVKSCVRSERVPIHYFILCVGMFPALSMLATNISLSISEILKQLGVPVLDVNSVIPAPETPVQIFFLFFVMAVLPAVCEEFIYRGLLLGGVSEFGKVGAVIVSSFAFGMMHATVQQIPFAFLIGLFLGYVTIRFKSIVLPVVLHFLNNAVSCFIFVLQNYLDEETVIIIDALMSMFFIVSGFFCTIIFIVASIHDRAKAKLQVSPDVCNCSTDEESPVEEESLSFFKTTIRSWGFWLFTVIYLIYTCLNILLTAASV
ncbi:MAG: CPBP family intramembrane metalloprotease [Clostridia bacterium]|nr:CPBP family intramembrane metalloprotease [Clostridia bacterium]